MSEDKTCQECEHWKYDKFTETHYGTGCGRCENTGEPMSCEHPACVALRLRTQNGGT